MEKTIKIQTKTIRPAALVFLTILLFSIGAFGIWVLMSFIFPMLEGFWELKITAIAVIVVIMICAIYLIIIQSSKTKPGLIIDDQGITDDSNFMGVGFIPWSDITAVREDANGFKQKLIVVIVKNPDVYINKSSQMRVSRQTQHKQFGSPIVIAANSLESNSQEIISILKNRLGMKPE
jgi:hypothetical protein